MHRQRNIYQSHALDLLRNCLSDGQDGGCKQRGQTATIWLKALFMPRLAVCSRDLHWHWINWTLLCDTMEVSMLRLAWLPIAQHAFQPALAGRLELISRKIVSTEQGQRLSRWADLAKNYLQKIIQFRDIHDRDISGVHCITDNRISAGPQAINMAAHVRAVQKKCKVIIH